MSCCLLCWQQRRKRDTEQNEREGECARLELVQRYAPTTRVQAAALAFEKEEKRLRVRRLHIELAKLLLEVDWVAACRAYAQQGYHSIIVWAETNPWEIKHNDVLTALERVCELIAVAIKCKVVKDLRLGDYATAIQDNGSLIINWATLRDAKQWRDLHHGHDRWMRCLAPDLIRVYAPLYTQERLVVLTTPSQTLSPILSLASSASMTNGPM